MIETGRLEKARKKLIKIYKKIDNDAGPKDWVTGEAVDDLATRMRDLKQSLSSM